jgi:mono/diheme cytochrome c family protein
MKINFARVCFLALCLFTAICFFGTFAEIATAQENNPPALENRKWNYDEIKNAPEKARRKRNPFEHDADAVLAGGKLFQRECAGCHGMKAEGGKRGPSLLREEVQKASPGAVFWLLSNGVVRRGMPDWSKLPEPQRWQIVVFLKSFRTATAPKENSGV